MQKDTLSKAKLLQSILIHQAYEGALVRKELQQQLIKDIVSDIEKEQEVDQ